MQESKKAPERDCDGALPINHHQSKSETQRSYTYVFAMWKWCLILLLVKYHHRFDIPTSSFNKKNFFGPVGAFLCFSMGLNYVYIFIFLCHLREYVLYMQLASSQQFICKYNYSHFLVINNNYITVLKNAENMSAMLQ